MKCLEVIAKILCVILAYYICEASEHEFRFQSNDITNDKHQIYDQEDKKFSIQEVRNGSFESFCNAITKHYLSHLGQRRSNRSSKCNNSKPSWPQLELFVPVNLKHSHKSTRRYEFEVTFLRTLLFFWPLKISNTSVVAVIDQELEDTMIGAEVKTTVSEAKHRFPGGISVLSIPPSPYYSGGKNRQQYYMLWADNFTRSDFIGFCDADTAFITRIDLEDLFEQGRPVVNARAGYHPAGDGVSEWTRGTYRTLGIKEPFKCMSYFPVSNR